MLTSRLLLGLPLGLLLFGECTPTSTELLANLTKGHVRIFLDNFGTSLLGELHVTGKRFLRLVGFGLGFLCVIGKTRALCKLQADEDLQIDAIVNSMNDENAGIGAPGFTCSGTYLGFLSFGFLGWHVDSECWG